MLTNVYVMTKWLCSTSCLVIGVCATFSMRQECHLIFNYHFRLLHSQLGSGANAELAD